MQYIEIFWCLKWFYFCHPNCTLTQRIFKCPFPSRRVSPPWMEILKNKMSSVMKSRQLLIQTLKRVLIGLYHFVQSKRANTINLGSTLIAVENLKTNKQRIVCGIAIARIYAGITMLFIVTLLTMFIPVLNAVTICI